MLKSAWAVIVVSFLMCLHLFQERTAVKELRGKSNVEDTKAKMEELQSENNRLRLDLEAMKAQAKEAPTASVVPPAAAADRSLASPLNITAKNQNNDPEGIMFMVMGKAGSFQPWWNLAQQVNTSIMLVYASYDVPVDTAAINSTSCQSIFIHNTSWTEGRNLLAENALRRESQRGKQFDFWAFVDDDIQLLCHEGASQLDCWNLLLDFMAKDMPKQAAMVGLGEKKQNWNRRKHRPAYVSVTTVDAIFNAFKREYVPFLLPYVTLAPGESWWHSQGALFQIQNGCFRNAVVSPPVAYVNGVHREYPRGLDGNRLIQTLHDNYDPYAKELDFLYRAKLAQYKDSMSFATAEALAEHLPVLNFTACMPLSQRFREWKANVTLGMDQVERRL